MKFTKLIPALAIALAVLAAVGVDRYLVSAQDVVELPTVVYPAAAQEVSVNFGTSPEYLDLLARVENLEGLLQGLPVMTSEPVVVSRSVEVSKPRLQRSVTVERNGQVMSCRDGSCTVTRTRTRNSGLLSRVFRR